MNDSRTPRFDVLIVGAGHAGAQAAIALRQQGFQGSIGLLGDEPVWPYERPPLSKEYLSGEKDFERILLRPEAFWAEREVTFLLGRRVTEVEAEAHQLTAADGAVFGYGTLIWAAGGSPRRLPCEGADLAGVHSIRTCEDVDRMRAELDATTRVVIVGGGYIGLETAAVLRKLGKQVTLLEAMDRVLARVAGEPVSRFYEAEHAAHGVDIQLGVKVEAIVGSQGRATGVRLDCGRTIAADMVVVGIGIVAEVAPLLAAGARGGNGVEVDEYCRTSLPDIYAVGDCALYANRFAGGALVRVESVQNANDQAITAAKAIAGVPAPYSAAPWFWSNQYDLRLQTVGLSLGHDASLVRGDPATRSFTVVYLKAGRVIALDCVNRPKDYVQGRALVLSGVIAQPEQLADPDVSLKTLAAPALETAE